MFLHHYLPGSFRNNRASEHHKRVLLWTDLQADKTPTHRFAPTFIDLVEKSWMLSSSSLSLLLHIRAASHVFSNITAPRFFYFIYRLYTRTERQEVWDLKWGLIIPQWDYWSVPLNVLKQTSWQKSLSAVAEEFFRDSEINCCHVWLSREWKTNNTRRVDLLTFAAHDLMHFWLWTWTLMLTLRHIFCCWLIEFVAWITATSSLPLPFSWRPGSSEELNKNRTTFFFLHTFMQWRQFWLWEKNIVGPHLKAAKKNCTAFSTQSFFSHH